MKKIDVGQTVQILANIGVIVGIVFLVLEINQNNEQLSAQSRYNYYQERIETSRDIALSGEIAEIIAKTFAAEPVSPAESIRLSAYFDSALTAWEYEYGEFRRGQITAEEFNIPAKRNRFESLRPVIGPAWDAYRGDAPADFRAFMEREVIRE